MKKEMSLKKVTSRYLFYFVIFLGLLLLWYDLYVSAFKFQVQMQNHCLKVICARIEYGLIPTSTRSMLNKLPKEERLVSNIQIQLLYLPFFFFHTRFPHATWCNFKQGNI